MDPLNKHLREKKCRWFKVLLEWLKISQNQGSLLWILNWQVQLVKLTGQTLSQPWSSCTPNSMPNGKNTGQRKQKNSVARSSLPKTEQRTHPENLKKSPQNPTSKLSALNARHVPSQCSLPSQTLTMKERTMKNASAFFRRLTKPQIKRWHQFTTPGSMLHVMENFWNTLTWVHTQHQLCFSTTLRRTDMRSWLACLMRSQSYLIKKGFC